MDNKVIFYLILVAALTVTYDLIGLTSNQMIASTIITAIILGTIFFLEYRIAIALIGVSLLFSLGLLNIEQFITFSSLNIIIFLASMMLFVAFLEKNEFFEFIVEKILEKIGGGNRLFIIIMILSAVFAALVDEVTSILFMLSIVFYLTKKIKVNPIPFIILTVFATNIGSSATAIGNPVGVMIALNAKLTFTDFLASATPTTLVILAVFILTAYVCFNKEIKEFTTKSKKLGSKELVTAKPINNKIIISSTLFLIVITGLLLHHEIEKALNLETNSMLLGIALLASGITLLLEKSNLRQFVETKVDWSNLLFFMLLFASVGALESTGVMQLISQAFIGITSSKIILGILILIISGLLSAILDNVLAVAIFIPIIQGLQNTGLAGNYLWWSLLFGATLFGNLTPIGSTANIVSLGLMEKRGLNKISFTQWMKYSLPIVMVTGLTALVMIYLQS